MSLVRNELIVPRTPAADHIGKEGYAVKLDGDGKSAIHDSATTAPFGVITEGGKPTGSPATGVDSIALPGAPPIYIKLDATPGTVIDGTKLQVTATGTFKADAGSGARVLCVQALETGSANELIEGRLIEPVVHTS